MASVVAQVVRLDRLKRLSYGALDIEGLVVDQAMEPLLVEVALHGREATLDRLRLGRVWDVVDRRYLEPLVHLLAEISFVHAEVVHEDRQRRIIIGLAQPTQVAAKVDLVNGVILYLDQFGSFLDRHCCDHRLVAEVDVVLVDAKIAVLTAPLESLKRTLGEVDLVEVDDLQAVVTDFLQLL